MANNEELPEVDLIGLLSKQSIRQNLIVGFVEHGSILARNPTPHPLLQLRDAHPVAMPLILDQLMVQYRKLWAIIWSCGSKGHIPQSAQTLWLTGHSRPWVNGLKEAVWLPFIVSRVARVGRAARTSSLRAGYAF